MFDQGIEALSKSVASIDSRKLEGNRAMSLSDLLIKVLASQNPLFIPANVEFSLSSGSANIRCYSRICSGVLQRAIVHLLMRVFGKFLKTCVIQLLVSMLPLATLCIKTES